MNKGLVFVIMMAFICLASFSFTTDSGSQGDSWPVPDKYLKMKNPIPADKASLKIGKKLYNKHCKSCHGADGLGDGSKAAQLDTPCGDLSEDAYKDQADGAKFYKTIEGRDDMPGYKKKIPDEEDIWHIINYMDTF